jgi:hypothetical protein
MVGKEKILWMMVMHLNWLEPYQGAACTQIGYSGRTSLRREQCDEYDHLLGNGSVNTA